MNKKLTKIDFEFENCEVGTLPIEAVPAFHLEHVQKDYDHDWNEMDAPADELSCELSCEAAYFKIDYELASKVKTNFMEDDAENNEKNNLAGRFLYWTNLSSITLHYDDGNEEFIWLPYEEQNPRDLFNTANKLLSIKVVQDDPWEVSFNEAYKNHRMIIISIEKN